MRGAFATVMNPLALLNRASTWLKAQVFPAGSKIGANNILHDGNRGQNGGNLAELDQAANFTGALQKGGLNVLTTDDLEDLIDMLDFSDGDASISGGDTITFSHGLSTGPTLVLTFVQCTSADAGFSAGDIIPLEGWHSNSGAEYGVQVTATATQITCQFGNNGVRALDSGGQKNDLNLSNWQLLVLAGV